MKFNYGNDIIVYDNAPNNFNPGKAGSVCGMREVIDQNTAKDFNVAMRSILYTIEFDDGHDMEIPEIYIRLL